MTAHFNYLSANAVHLPVGMPISGRYVCDDRHVRVDAIHDDGVVDLYDLNTHTRLHVRDAETGKLAPPTLEWIREKYREGVFRPIGAAETPDERQGRFALLDPAECEERDPKANWKYGLASRAFADGVKLTDATCGEWLADNYGLLPSDLEFAKPSATSLRRWVSKLKKQGKRVSSLVSAAGRRKGQSQLDPVIDALVHEAALFFWSRPRAQMVDAQAWLNEQIDLLNDNLPPGRVVKFDKPSKETLRKRINRLRCFDTVRAKHGEKEAKRLFQGSGEPILVTELLDTALMDATTLEQIIAMDDDWQLPACKVKVVALMDMASSAILSCHVYAGPNRAETSIEAVIAAMTPPDVPELMLAKHPILGWMFGKFSRIIADNEKALIGPATIRSFNEVGIDIMPPPVEMPTAKAKLERFFRTLKQCLAQLPGTMVDPKRAKDLDWDAVGSTVLTLPQLRAVVAQVIASYNVTPSKGLDGQSPAQVWQRLASRKPVRCFEDVARVRRVLGRDGIAVLTHAGVEINGIRYRDAKPVDRLLDNMANTEAVRGRRKDGSVSLEVRYRISPGNIDTVQVYDTLEEDWVVLPSTQPEYTHQLSEWEHREFKLQAKRRNEPFASERHRLESKATTLRMIDELAPQVAFQQRRTMAALHINRTVKHLGGGAAARPMPVELPGMSAGAAQGTAECGGRDAAPGDRSASGKKVSGGKRALKAPERPPGYYGDEPEDFEEIDFEAIDVEGDDELEISPEDPLDLPDHAGDAA